MGGEASLFSQLSLNELRDLADLTATVASAADVGMFTALAAGEAQPSELAERLGLNERSLGIVLPVLAELGILEAVGVAYQMSDSWGPRLADPSSDEFVAGGLPLGSAIWGRSPSSRRCCARENRFGSRVVPGTKRR